MGRYVHVPPRPAPTGRTREPNSKRAPDLAPPSASAPSPRSVVFRFEIGSRSPAERPAGTNRTPPPPEDDHFPCPRRDHNPGTTHPDERTAHGRTGPPRNNPHFSLKFRDCSLIARTRCRAPMCADPPLRTWETISCSWRIAVNRGFSTKSYSCSAERPLSHVQPGLVCGLSAS